MTVNPSIDPARLLEEQLAQASPDLLRELLSTFINTLLSAEADAVCGAAYGAAQPGAGQPPQRLPAPRLRHPRRHHGRGDPQAARPGSYFPEWLLERRKRAERALTTVVATCYLLGVSTRRMDKLVQSLGITGLSKSQVSVMAKELDAHVEEFRTRPLADAGPVHVRGRRRAGAEGPRGRPGGRRCTRWSPPASTPTGTARSSASRSPPAEDGAGWLGFFRDLTARGLTGVKLVTSDAHAGLVAAIAATLPGAAWQRCRTHYAANLMSVTPKSSLGLGQGAAALDLRPARRRGGARPVRPGPRRPGREAPRRRRAPRGRPRRHPRLHRVPQGDLAPDLVQQPQRTAQPRDPPPHRRRRDLPRPRTRSSASSAPSWPSNTTNGPKAAATSDSTSSPDAAGRRPPPTPRR